MQIDYTLNTLLDLNGTIIDQEGGYWVKFEAWQVNPSDDVPHGIRYSLTLHNKYGKRIIGFDNSHAIKLPKKFKYAGQRSLMITNIGMLQIKACHMNLKMQHNCSLISSQKLTAC